MKQRDLVFLGLLAAGALILTRPRQAPMTQGAAPGAAIPPDARRFNDPVTGGTQLYWIDPTTNETMTVAIDKYGHPLSDPYPVGSAPVYVDPSMGGSFPGP